MGKKKQPGRFTLQFNLEDPQQRAVSELLEQQGRRKAQFITSAVLLYTQHPKPQGHDEGTPTADEAALEQMLLSILEKHPPIGGGCFQGTDGIAGKRTVEKTHGG